MGDLTNTCYVSTPCLVNDFVRYKLNEKGYAWEPYAQITKSTSIMKALRTIYDEFEVKNITAFDYSCLPIWPFRQTLRKKRF